MCWSCPTLCNPVACSLPGSYVHGIFQARVLQWVAISSSRGSSWPRDRTCVSCISWIGRWILYQLCHLEFLVFSIRKSNSTEGQNRGGRESRRRKKKKDEEEDTPKEAELKWGCPPTVNRRVDSSTNQCPLGLHCTDSGKCDQEAACPVAFSVPACVSKAFLPANPDKGDRPAEHWLRAESLARCRTDSCPLQCKK